MSADPLDATQALGPEARAVRARLEAGEGTVGVVGLGFVGTPLAALLADAGFDVVGVDIDDRRIAAINAGRSPIQGREPGLDELLERVTSEGRLRATDDHEELRDADAVLVAVQTPVASDQYPRYEALRSALVSLGTEIPAGALVVIESTLAPGTMDRMVAPTLEMAAGTDVGPTLQVVHCPERVMPGRLLANLRTMHRAVGGMTPAAAETAVALYRHIVDADLDVTDALTAELVKTGENAYRDVQIAFANEMALVCDSLGADVWRLRSLLNKSPGRNMLLPGAGVGGHCIPKDPWLLIANARLQEDFVPRLVPAARSVNDQMPSHVARLAERALAEHERPLDTARVLLLGWSYLPDSDDTRNAPSRDVAEALVGRPISDEDIRAPISGGRIGELRAHDPWVDRMHDIALDELMRDGDAVVLLVAHSEYGDIDWRAMRRLVRTPILIDGRGMIDRDAARDAGWDLYTVGVGR